MLADVACVRHARSTHFVGAKMSHKSPQQLGGAARAQKLDRDERAKIASEAAKARWVTSNEIKADPNIPFATHQGQVSISGLELDCYVLNNGKRVFHKRGMAKALGLRSEGGNAFVKTISGKSISKFVSEDLADRIDSPFYFLAINGEVAHGYDAELLIDVCKAIKNASESGSLSSSQSALAAQAQIIIHAFAKVGIAAVIDEATGFQEVRGPDALRILVEQYIEKEKREWVKEFPDEYYDELNRIFGSKKLTQTKHGKVIQNRPQHFAKFTRKFVYHPLENGSVLEELDRLNPKINDKGTRRDRFHSHLSQDYGLQKLKTQVQEVLTMMKLSDNLAQFKRFFDKRFKGQYQPDLFDK